MWFETRERKEGGGSGGGGRAKIRLGRTGPRGRVYAKPPKGRTVVAKSKFIKAGKGSRPAIRGHLRYIEERERGEGEKERKFFDRDKEGIERKDVYDAMMKGRGDRAAMHTIILSPGDNKTDMQEYTRESMEALEDRLGHKLDWYAITHENTDHHHIHVVIAGKIPDRDYERGRQGAGDRQSLDGRWTSEDKDLKELLGDRYDEKAEKDPCEERREDYEFGSGEREPTDPAVKDLIGDSARSPVEVRDESRMNMYDRISAAQEAAQARGEVWLDKGDLNELRAAGNDYVERERSLDREIERSIEREMLDDPFSLDRERDLDRGRDDDTFGSRGDRGDRGSDDREERDRDDFGRGR
jgi:hypothetical protein